MTHAFSSPQKGMSTAIYIMHRSGNSLLYPYKERLHYRYGSRVNQQRVDHNRKIYLPFSLFPEALATTMLYVIDFQIH